MTIRKILNHELEGMIPDIEGVKLHKLVQNATVADIKLISEAVGQYVDTILFWFVRRRCHVCACTTDNCSQCVEKTGSPCSWVNEDTCSACVKDGRSVKKNLNR